MNIALWICQALVAAIFLNSAAWKGTQSPEKCVAAGQTGVEGLPVPLIRFIAVAELCGVIGLIVPLLLHIVPVLTPLAAIGLGTIMVLASIVHFRRREPKTAVANLAILVICVFIAYGRAHV